MRRLLMLALFSLALVAGRTDTIPQDLRSDTEWSTVGQLTTAPLICGDTIVDAGEDCDDGGESASCNGDCTTSICGDGKTNNTAGETCDDSNTTPGDGCSATCQIEITGGCGDGFVDVGEDCDGDGAGTGGETATCNLDCTTSACLDGKVNVTAGEECDDARITSTCDVDCTLAVCGDGTINPSGQEDCEEGAVQTATCEANCQTPFCGDGTLNTLAGEECEDNSDCTSPDICLAGCSCGPAGGGGGDDNPPILNKFLIVGFVAGQPDTSNLVTVQGVIDLENSVPVEIQVCNENGGNCSAWQDVAVSNSIAFTGLTPETQYCYRGRARDAFNNVSAFTNGGSGPNASECRTTDAAASASEVHDDLTSDADWDFTRVENSVVQYDGTADNIAVSPAAETGQGAAIYTGSSLPGSTFNVCRKATITGSFADARPGLVLQGNCDDPVDGCLLVYAEEAFGSGELRAEARYYGTDWGTVTTTGGNCEDDVLSSWFVSGDVMVACVENEWGTGTAVIKAMSWSTDPCSGSGCPAALSDFSEADCTADANCRNFRSVSESECSEVPGILAGNAAGVYGRAQGSTDFTADDFAAFEITPETFTPTTSIAVSTPNAFTMTIGSGPPATQIINVSNSGTTGSFDGTVTIQTIESCGVVSNWLSVPSTFPTVTTSNSVGVTLNPGAATDCDTAGSYDFTLELTCVGGDDCDNDPITVNGVLVVSDPLPPGSWPAVESRIETLSATASFACSEPMDEMPWTPVNSGSVQDPPNSQNATECTGLNTFSSSSPDPGDFLPVALITSSPYNLPAVPAGSIASSVYVFDGRKNVVKNVSQDVDLANTSRTYAQRQYVAFGSNFECTHSSNPAVDSRCKIQRNDFPAQETENRSTNTIRPSTGGAGGWTMPDSSGNTTFDIDDVRGVAWLRIESNWSHNPTTNRAEFRWHHTRLDTCEKLSGTEISLNTNSSMTVGCSGSSGCDRNMIADGHRDPKLGGSLQTNMHTGWGPMAAAQVAYDPNFEIGCSPEFEGSCCP